MQRYFNIFEYGKHILNRLGVMFERACMSTTKDKYFEKILETVVVHSDRHNVPLSNENIRQAVRKFIAKR